MPFFTCWCIIHATLKRIFMNVLTFLSTNKLTRRSESITLSWSKKPCSGSKTCERHCGRFLFLSPHTAVLKQRDAVSWCFGSDKRIPAETPEGVEETLEENETNQPMRQSYPHTHPQTHADRQTSHSTWHTDCQKMDLIYFTYLIIYVKQKSFMTNFRSIKAWIWK